MVVNVFEPVMLIVLVKLPGDTLQSVPYVCDPPMKVLAVKEVSVSLTVEDVAERVKLVVVVRSQTVPVPLRDHTEDPRVRVLMFALEEAKEGVLRATPLVLREPLVRVQVELPAATASCKVHSPPTPLKVTVPLVSALPADVIVLPVVVAL